MRRLLERLVVSQLRRDLRRIEWIGALPQVRDDRPLVIYANHQAFYDGLVLGFLARRVLRRQPIVWMEEFDRFPAAGWLGALPFPPNDGVRRVATIRRTVERLRRDTGSAFIYFPEGRLHPFDEELLDFPVDAMGRLARAFPPCWWWPVALGISSWDTARPVATLIGGSIDPQPPADARSQLRSLKSQLADREATRITVLEGKRGPDERWAWAARLLPHGTAG